MIATPISDLMCTYQESLSIEHFDALVERLATTAVGVHLFGVAPPEAERNLVADGKGISLASTTHGDGKSRLVAFADPREFNRRFGPKCNGEMLGKTLFEVVLHNPDCHGILINSATSETSVVIPRSDIEMAHSYLCRSNEAAQEPVEQPMPKPRWWQVWK